MLFSAPGMVFGLTLAAIAFYCESLLRELECWMKANAATKI